MTFKPYPKSLPKIKEQKPKKHYSLRKAYIPTGELQVFKQIWIERIHVCDWCKCRLEKFDHSFFDHIIPKSKSESLRLVKENIRLLCRECHHVRHNGTKKQIAERMAIGEGKNRIIIASHDKQLDIILIQKA